MRAGVIWIVIIGENHWVGHLRYWAGLHHCPLPLDGPHRPHAIDGAAVRRGTRVEAVRVMGLMHRC